MPDTRTASRSQKRKRSVQVSAPALAADPHTKKKSKRASDAQPPDTPPGTRPLRASHTYNAIAPTVIATDAEGNPEADTTDVSDQTEQQDWNHLIDRILQELRETFSLAGNDGAVEEFLCELLSVILLRSYRAYSLEKLFGQGNSGPRGPVKDAIDQDNREMSFKAVTEFTRENGYQRIETVRGNRASDSLTGNQFFDWVWGDYPISRKHWDTADFRQQFRRICSELAGIEVGSMRVKFERTLKYRFFQSQTVFPYPHVNNGTFASVGKSVNGEGPFRRVWYHQTPLPEEVSTEALKEVMRCNENPVEDLVRYYPESEKPKRLPEDIQSIRSWELVKSYCRTHRLRFAL